VTLAIWGLPWRWRQYVSPKRDRSYYTTRCHQPEDIIMNVHRTDGLTSTAGCFTAVSCTDCVYQSVRHKTAVRCHRAGLYHISLNAVEHIFHFPVPSSKCTVCVCVCINACVQEWILKPKPDARQTSGTLPDTIHTYTHTHIRTYILRIQFQAWTGP
jgi:hypothetical protein